MIWDRDPTRNLVARDRDSKPLRLTQDPQSDAGGRGSSPSTASGPPCLWWGDSEEVSAFPFPALNLTFYFQERGALPLASSTKVKGRIIRCTGEGGSQSICGKKS